MWVSTTHPILSMWILIYSFDTYYVWAACAMNYLFLNRNFAPNSRKLLKRWCGKVLSISERKVVLVAILEGKSMPFNMAANTNHTTLLKNQGAIKYLPEMRFLSNFGCKMIFFMPSVNFWHQQDSNSLFKGNIGHVTSKCKWPMTTTTTTTTSNWF